MSLTTDPDHPDLKRGGPDNVAVPQPVNVIRPIKGKA